MKKAKALAVVVCAVVCLGLVMLSGCGDKQTSSGMTALTAPTNVAVNYGAEDTVSFDAVENAVSYQVYVYQDGDEYAKVTEGEESPVALASPLGAGEYLVSVIAVGDGLNWSNSLGSEPVAYTASDAGVLTPLGQVSDIAIDFENVDPDNAAYPVISFTGVENASRYLVDIFRADKDGEKQLTSLGYTTRLTVPADSADGCMLSSTNYAALNPGYYVVEVTACGDDETWSNGEPFAAQIAWTGVEAVKPVITAAEAEAGGIQIALENYASYNAGTAVSVGFYADEGCTELVYETTLTYTTSEFFGNINHNNTLAVEVQDEGTALVTGTTYYVCGGFDADIYTGDITSDVVPVLCSTAGTGSASGASGASGGMGGSASGEASGEAG